MDRLIATAAALPAAVAASSEGEKPGDKADGTGGKKTETSQEGEAAALFGALFSLTMPHPPASPVPAPWGRSAVTDAPATGNSAGPKTPRPLRGKGLPTSGLPALLLTGDAAQVSAPASGAIRTGPSGSGGEIVPPDRAVHLRAPGPQFPPPLPAGQVLPTRDALHAARKRLPAVVDGPAPVPTPLSGLVLAPTVTTAPPVPDTGTGAPTARRTAPVPGAPAKPAGAATQLVRALGDAPLTAPTGTPKETAAAAAVAPASPTHLPRVTPAAPPATMPGGSASTPGPVPAQTPTAQDAPLEAAAGSTAPRPTGQPKPALDSAATPGSGNALPPAPQGPQSAPAVPPPAAPQDASPPEPAPAAAPAPVDRHRPLELARDARDPAPADGLDPAPADAAPREAPRSEAPPRIASHQAATPASASLGHSVARQIAAAAPLNLDHRPVQISLQPAELGHVRMTLSSHDGVMTLVISAERPETLDLMRRHSDLLTGAFGDTSFAGLNLSFGQQAGSGQDFGQPPAPETIDPATVEPLSLGGPAAAPPQAIRLAVPALDRLDLRL